MISFFINTFGLKATEYLVGFVVISGLLVGVYGYIHHQGVLAEKAVIERQKDAAIKQAHTARDRIHELCTQTPANCTNPDDWRD